MPGSSLPTQHFKRIMRQVKGEFAFCSMKQRAKIPHFSAKDSDLHRLGDFGGAAIALPLGRNAIRLRCSGFCAERRHTPAWLRLLPARRAGNTPSLLACRSRSARQAGCAIAAKNNAKFMFCCIKFKKHRYSLAAIRAAKPRYVLALLRAYARFSPLRGRAGKVGMTVATQMTGLCV